MAIVVMGVASEMGMVNDMGAIMETVIREWQYGAVDRVKRYVA